MDRYVAMLLGSLLGGCAAVAGAPAAPAAGTAFDGSYSGQNVLIRGGGYPCGAPAYPINLTVSGGRFDYPFPVNLQRTAPITMQIAADGTFVGQMQYGVQDYTMISLFQTAWVYVRGRIAGGTLDATITNDRCTHRITAQRN